MNNYRLPTALTFETVASALHNVKNHITESGADRFTFDLAEVKSCDTAGLAYLVEIKRFCQLQKKVHSFENMPELVLSLLALYELEEILL